MLFPDYRPRRLRQTEAFRRMIRETHLNADDFILPLFAIDGQSVKKPIDAMPGHFQMSLDYFIWIVGFIWEIIRRNAIWFDVNWADKPI